MTVQSNQTWKSGLGNRRKKGKYKPIAKTYAGLKHAVKSRSRRSYAKPKTSRAMTYASLKRSVKKGGKHK